MGRRGPRAVESYAFIVEGLRQGMFASLAEAAQIAGVTPQRVGQWCAAAGIDWRVRRYERLRGLWFQEVKRQLMLAKGVHPKRPTKQQLRRQVAQAKVEWDRRRKG